MKEIVVVLSGGMDSTVLLHYHLAQGDAARALTIDYGQRHRKEIDAAKLIAQALSVRHEVVDLSGLAKILPGSSQTDGAVKVPEGHYSEETMKATVVPNRNMILLAVAIGHAIAHKFDGVSYGAHQGDNTIYPDCREEFVEALSQTTRLCDWHQVEIYRPFIGNTKADIVKKGYLLGVDFSRTWSCYVGGRIHCGKCGTCVERLLAFREAGVVDPTEYVDKEFAFKAEENFRKTQ